MKHATKSGKSSGATTEAESITSICERHGVSVPAVSRAIELGRIDASGFGKDERGRRFVSDRKAADAAIADFAANPPKLGRPGRATLRARAEDRDIEWRRRAIAAHMSVWTSLEKLFKGPTVPASMQSAWPGIERQLHKLDALLEDGPRGPLL